MKEWLNPFSSFRARIVFFVLLVLAVTILVLFFINRQSEQRITRLVAEHLKDTSLAVDLAQTSFTGDKYLYQLIPQDGRLGIGLDESHVIHRIIVAAANGRIIDSSERDDIDQTIQQVLGALTPAPFAIPPRSATTDGREPEQVFTYPVETEKGKRRVVIIISPHRLSEIVREEGRKRWLGITLLGLLLVLTVAFASWRFTHPIRALMNAAARVSAGDFDFNVTIKRRDEMGRLAQTFNEMLAGLRGKRELEEKLQRAERSALTGRIASGIAHEIRNPLSFISLSVDYLRDKFAPTAEAARHDYTKLIDSVKEEILRLNGMVSDFLNFGRPARLKLRELDARALVEEVLVLVRAKAEQQNVRVSVQEVTSDERGEAFDTHLKADAEQLKTCFSNIAINAVQAMTDGGELKLTLHPQPHNIRIEFADTGPGIAPEALGQIFEPYFSTKETGIGLGLALTRKLIEDHGGQILVSSEVGAGTTFTITLPRAPAEHPQAAGLPQTVVSI
ncbi:MAG: HAMP domain-containing protein [Acidobacteria bacterium]|nr:HAMP domain-containing protein [Acidobacteriota bacterium]